MEIKRICQSQWNDVKNIYMEAFPKEERKPFFFLKRAVRKGKSEIWVASESDVVAGFIVLIPYHDMILVEYAVKGPAAKYSVKYAGSMMISVSCC